MKVREAMAKTADLKQVDLKQVRDEVADRVGRAAKELTSGAGNAARELTATADESLSSQAKAARKRMPAQRGRSPLPMLTGAIAGAVTVYFFDPERGRARRAQFIDWSGARLRRGQRAVEQLLSRTGDSAASLPARMIRLQSGPRPADDLTLRDRVESEVFRNPEVPKGQINFDVEAGVVTVRGQVDNALQIAKIEKDVLKVPGVRGVENLLHVDGTPAPNKAEARGSS
jgi:osmotically-inducible protein OsmY